MPDTLTHDSEALTRGPGRPAGSRPVQWFHVNLAKYVMTMCCRSLLHSHTLTGCAPITNIAAKHEARDAARATPDYCRHNSLVLLRPRWSCCFSRPSATRRGARPSASCGTSTSATAPAATTTSAPRCEYGPSRSCAPKHSNGRMLLWTLSKGPSAHHTLDILHRSGADGSICVTGTCAVQPCASVLDDVAFDRGARGGSPIADSLCRMTDSASHSKSLQAQHTEPRAGTWRRRRAATASCSGWWRTWARTRTPWTASGGRRWRTRCADDCAHTPTSGVLRTSLPSSHVSPSVSLQEKISSVRAHSFHDCLVRKRFAVSV